ncbi:MAG: sigma-E factor negative regulatory protein, partial [Dokdonella sp.]
MNQQNHEQLSALMDGELSRDETAFLLRRATHDASIVQRWSGFHTIRYALRRQEIVAVRADFASVIMQRISEESAPLRGRSSALLRWASGGAIAASVAVVALWATAPGIDPSADAGRVAATPVPAQPQVRPALVSAGVGNEFRPPMLSPSLAAQPASASSAGFNAATQPIDPRLQSYLIRHYDAAGSIGQSSMMPHVLLVVPQSPQAIAPVPAQDRADRRRPPADPVMCRRKDY